MNENLSITLQSGASPSIDETTSLTLEQEKEIKDRIYLYDLKQMWATARAGKSARTYKPYSNDIKMTESTIAFSIGFYVWTVPDTLDYELETTLGDIGADVQLISRERIQSHTFELSRYVNLNKTFSDMAYEWETPLIDENGVIHPSLPITTAHGKLIIDEPYFGVARVNLIEYGNYHKVYVELENVDEDGNPLVIDNIKIKITASYQNVDGETEVETLDLEIPEAVKAALRVCEGSPGLICYDCPPDWKVDVYYNECDGSILDVHAVDRYEDDSWCMAATSGGRWGHLL